MKSVLHKLSSGMKGLLSLGALAALPFAAEAQTYCVPSNTSSTTYYIANVTSTGALANINNTSVFSTGGYIDYTASQTILSYVGGTFNLQCTAGPSGYTYMWNVWVDWNDDGDFDDPGENVFTQSSYINSINPLITVPATTVGGQLRLRVRDAYISPAPPACGANTYGEAEDYTLIIAPNDNVAVGSFASPTTLPFCSNSKQMASIAVINRGSNAVSSATINWSIDGVTQTPVSLATPLTNYGDSTIVDLGEVFFPDLNPKLIRVWTASPNGMTDTKPEDDSTSKSFGATLTGVIVDLPFHDTTICAGTSVTLDAGTHPNNPIYIWNNGVITQTNSVSQEGMYIVKVQNSDGCFDRDTAYVTVNPLPVANSVAIIDNGGCAYTFNIIAAQNIDTYNWDFGDGTTGPGPGPKNHTYTTPGQYNVVVDMSNECGNVTITRLVVCEGGNTGIGDLDALQHEIKMYPNPAQDVVVIEHKADFKLQNVEVYNLMGQKLYESAVKGDTHKVNVAAMAAGIYNVVITTDKGKVTKKLEVIK